MIDSDGSYSILQAEMESVPACGLPIIINVRYS